MVGWKYDFWVDYLPRVADAELERRLSRAGAVLIEGAKGCGKTRTATRAAKSVLHVDTDLNVEPTMLIDPTLLLEGATPRLLDEWQWQPRLWDYVRHDVDDRQQPGQYILTGSATPNDDVRRHSGAGRFSALRMRPMSLWESGDSSGSVSWHDLRGGSSVRVAAEDWPIRQIAQTVVRGGWPATIGQGIEDSQAYVLDYLDLLAEADISRVDGVKRDPVRVRRLLASLGRNCATTASLATLVADVNSAGGSLGRDTAASYINALERLMIVEDQPAWKTALRDSATLRQAPKHHLVCPSLAAAALGATADKLIREPKTLGLLFESLAVRDLRVYSSVHRGKVYHYRDSRGREIDAIVEYPDGWMAVEIKLGVGSVDAACDNLLRVVSTIDTRTVGEPDALVVVSGGGVAYKRPDGVAVVPLNMLRP